MVVTADDASAPCALVMDPTSAAAATAVIGTSRAPAINDPVILFWFRFAAMASPLLTMGTHWLSPECVNAG
ncbi:MAG: hypothetical protein DWP92_02635 [Armatimonadetes bacterium]|nr:MAG: hypothetical protein DWP92_02635 [Armatimonadota bacterium]